MPIYCVAPGCKNTNDSKKKSAAQIELEKAIKVTFHVFPSNPVRRAEWIKIMKLGNRSLHKKSCLCSLHFTEKFIDRTSLVCVRLRENAVPYVLEETLCDDIIEDQTNVKNEIEISPLSIESLEHIVA